jgi:hypothetical protein
MLLTVGTVALPLAAEMIATMTSLALVVVKPVPITSVLVAELPV